MKKFVAVFFTLIIIFLLYVLYRTFKVSETPVHFHANFAVFINNKKVDFSDPSYMHLAPCTANDSEIHLEKEENVHLHDLVGNVVHVHQSKIVWNDLFNSIKFDLNKKSSQNSKNTLAFYLNGKKTDTKILNTPIRKEDKLLITADEKETPANIAQSEYFKNQYAQVGDDAKEYDNGSKGAEHCGAQGKRAFITRLKIALATLFTDIEI